MMVARRCSSARARQADTAEVLSTDARAEKSSGMFFESQGKRKCSTLYSRACRSKTAPSVDFKPAGMGVS